MTTFEDSLWDRLAREHAADTVALEPLRGRSRRPLAISAGAAGIAAVAAAGVLLFGASASTPPAYALTTNPDGSVTVSINNIETAIPVLNAEFRKDGIDETVIPVEADCANREVGVITYPGVTRSTTITLVPGRKYLAPGYDGVLAAEQIPDGSVALGEGAMKPPLPSCFNTTAGAVPTSSATTTTTETSATP
jgi:hypothetical protein